MRRLIGLGVAVVLCGATAVMGDGKAPEKKAPETFYTRPAIFSTRPNSLTEFQSINRFGPVGIGIELHAPAFVMKVKNVEEGSPAETTGKLKAGQIIETINGQKLKDIDPRIQLGKIIANAEATDGLVTLAVRDDEKAAIQKVTVSIPVLGPYSKTWPVNCKKSDKIVRDLADAVIEQGWDGQVRMNGPNMLFLLSTGEEKDLEVVRGWIKKSIEYNKDFCKKSGLRTIQWFISWGGPCLAEYYLRTGDKSILPLMKEMADAVRNTMCNDAWSGRGRANHHMGLAGTGTLTFLLLARQCGVEVEDGMLQIALQHFYRFAGRGVNPYMDSYPEEGFTDNGKNALLAYAMAAASALDPKGEESLYARARDVAAMSSFYSGSYMNHGHTGGGIGEVWRSAAMGLMLEKQPHQYRTFMDERAWWYDLSRRYDGSIGVLGGGNYDEKHVGWCGPTMGLTYTAPRKKLCIFGAPRSKYAKTHAIPARPWGTAADDEFFSLDAAADKDGKVASLDAENFAENSGVPMNNKLSAPEMSDEELLKYSRHAQQVFRVSAAERIYKEMRVHLILPLLKDRDARVRYVGVLAMPMPKFSARPEKCDPGFPMEKMSKEILSRLIEMLNDPEESWFVVDRVIKLLGRCSADELLPHTDRLISFLGHPEQWLRHSALTALVPLAVDARSSEKVLAAMERDVPNFIRRPGGLSSLAVALSDADPKIQKAVSATMGKIYLAYPGKNADYAGGLNPEAGTWYLSTVASALQAAPGGLDVLYKVAKKRYPEQVLPHRDLFLESKNIDSSPKAKEALPAVILNELIPEHVGKNWPYLQSLAASKKATQRGAHFGRFEAMDALVGLYKRAGVEGYDWEPYGTDRHNNVWDYFSFVPKEEGPRWDEELKNRYRQVSYPQGMENWFAQDFDATKAGWKKGEAPFANYDGKLPTPGNEGVKSKDCSFPICGCGDTPKTLWENEVLLMRRTFDVPLLKKGYRYRLLVGGRSHYRTGDGFCVHVNGQKLIENKGYSGRGAGGVPRGEFITTEFFADFKDGKAVVAATAFQRQSQRSHKVQGNLNIWLQQQKIPPFSEEHLHKSAENILMTNTTWQELQDPAKTISDPNEGKFRYDGKFIPNKSVIGVWKAIGDVSSIDQFKPGEKLVPIKNTKESRHGPKGLLMSEITFEPNGKTDALERLWSGDTLMYLARNYRGGAAYEALKMVTKTIDGVQYLFIEKGGFGNHHPADWKSPWIVLKR